MGSEMCIRDRLGVFGILWVHPELSWTETLFWTVSPGMAAWFAWNWYRLKKKAEERETLLKEQVASVDARHEELREAYLEQESVIQERTRSLQVANEKLRELDERKSAFVSIASHEIRTPLTVMKGFVENMLDGVTGDLHERQVLYLTCLLYTSPSPRDS